MTPESPREAPSWIKWRDWREMNPRALVSLLAKVIAAMRRDIEDAFAPLTQRQRLIELLAAVVLVCFTIALMAA